MRFLRMVVCKPCIEVEPNEDETMFEKKKWEEKERKEKEMERKENKTAPKWWAIYYVTVKVVDWDNPWLPRPHWLHTTHCRRHIHPRTCTQTNFTCTYTCLHVLRLCECCECVCAMKYAVCLSHCFHFSLAYLLHRSGFHCILLGMVNMPLCHVTFLANIISYRSRWGNVTYRHPTNTHSQQAKVWKCGDSVVMLKRREEKKTETN